MPSWKERLKNNYIEDGGKIASFIETEIIEKLIEEIPDSIVTNNGRDITGGHIWALKEQLRAKWLGKEQS